MPSMEPWQYVSDMTWKMLAGVLVTTRERLEKAKAEVDAHGPGDGRQERLDRAVVAVEKALAEVRARERILAGQEWS